MVAFYANRHTTNDRPDWVNWRTHYEPQITPAINHSTTDNANLHTQHLVLNKPHWLKKGRTIKVGRGFTGPQILWWTTWLARKRKQNGTIWGSGQTLRSWREPCFLLQLGIRFGLIALISIHPVTPKSKAALQHFWHSWTKVDAGEIDSLGLHMKDAASPQNSHRFGFFSEF